MTPNVPAVSVVMPVHNGLPYLPSAIDSILGQTFPDFEFIIVDDGSSDGSWELLSTINDVRVRPFRSPGKGLVDALNFGATKARGELLARMDADDISYSERLMAQVDRFRADADLGILCTNARVIDEAGAPLDAQRELWPVPASDFVRDGLLLRRPMKPIIHPSVMMRSAVLVRLGGYRKFPHAEDRDLWLRAIGACKFERLQLDLLGYRVHAGGVSRTSTWEQAVSSVMAVVNARVLESCGCDLFADAEDTFEAVESEARRRILSEVAPAANDFRSARSAVRARKWGKALSRSTSGIFRHGRQFQPDAARRATLKVSDECARLALNLLDMESV